LNAFTAKKLVVKYYNPMDWCRSRLNYRTSLSHLHSNYYRIVLNNIQDMLPPNMTPRHKEYVKLKALEKGTDVGRSLSFFPCLFP
jgi:hypothetical protein